MRLLRPAFLCVSLLLVHTVHLPAQQAAAAPGTEEQLQPALISLTQAVRQLRVDKWKAPGPVRDDAARNVDSIERDLEGTLPGLMAATVPGNTAALPIAQNFAVYRNLDALYDVVLRVSLTAELAAPDVEVEALDHALTQLEGARKALGDAITGLIAQQQQAMVQLQASSARAAAPPPAVPTTTVVNDGPEPSAKAAKAAKKKKAAPPPQ